MSLVKGESNMDGCKRITSNLSIPKARKMTRIATEEHEEWTVIKPKRRSRHDHSRSGHHSASITALASQLSNSCTFDSSSIENDTSVTEATVAKVQAKIHNIEVELQKNPPVFFTQLQEQLETLVEQLGSTRLELICYGIGPIHKAVNAQYQLACLLQLAKIIHTCQLQSEPESESEGKDDQRPLKIELFDPVLSSVDCNILEACTSSSSSIVVFNVLTSNDQARRQVQDQPTLFYMPHCPMRLYENVIGTNYGLSLEHVYLIGNSFEQYDSIVMDSHKRKTNLILHVRSFVREHVLSQCPAALNDTR